MWAHLLQGVVYAHRNNDDLLLHAYNEAFETVFDPSIPAV